MVAHAEWEASAQKRPDRLNQRLARDPRWQHYLAQVNPIGEFLFTITVHDHLAGVYREIWVNPRIEPGDSSDMETTTVDTRIPADVLTGSDSHVEQTYLTLTRKTYRWAAEQFGWPEPPVEPGQQQS